MARTAFSNRLDSVYRVQTLRSRVQGMECPTQSIQFGDLDELRQRGKNRVQELKERGYKDARIYDLQETSVGGIHASFVILGEPEAYNLPPAPEVPTAYLKSAWSSALLSATILVAIARAALHFNPHRNC